MRSIHADELVMLLEKQVGHSIVENNGDLRANIVYRGYTINFANAELDSQKTFFNGSLNFTRSAIVITDPDDSDDVNTDFDIVEKAILHINDVLDNGVPFTNVQLRSFAVQVNGNHVGYLNAVRDTCYNSIREATLSLEEVSVRVKDVPEDQLKVSVVNGCLISVTF